MTSLVITPNIPDNNNLGQLNATIPQNLFEQEPAVQEVTTDKITTSPQSQEKQEFVSSENIQAKEAATFNHEKIAKISNQIEPLKINSNISENQKPEPKEHAIIKEKILQLWVKTFSGIVDPDSMQEYFSESKLQTLAEKNRSEDLIEICSKLRQLDYPKLFKQNHNLMEIISPTLPHFFKACFDFIDLFPKLKERYEKEGDAGIYISVNIAASIKKYEKINVFWESLLKICSNDKNIEELENLAQQRFNFLKPNKRGNAWEAVCHMIDQVYGEKALVLHKSNFKEFKKIEETLSSMNKEWIKNNNWLTEVLIDKDSQDQQDEDFSPEDFVFAKVKMAKEQTCKLIKKSNLCAQEIQKKINKSIKNIQNDHKQFVKSPFVKKERKKIIAKKVFKHLP